MSLQQMPADRLLGITEVLATTRLTAEQLQQAVAEQGFPPPMPLGPWRFGWPASAVLRWIEMNPAL